MSANESQSLLVPVTGLKPDYGPFTTAPPGSLTDAKNVQIRTPGVIEPRGSFQLIPDPDALFIQQQSFVFDGSAYVAHTTDLAGNGPSLLRKDTTSSIGLPVSYWNAVDTGFTQGETYFSQAGVRGYYTSTSGVQALYSSAFSAAQFSGLPRPAGLFVYVYTDATAANNWLSPDSAIAYRIVHLRRQGQGQGNIFQSPPSSFTIASNVFPAATTRAVNIRVNVGTFMSIIPGDEIQLYRSVIQVAGATSLPSDEMRLRYTWTITAADITAEFVTLNDFKPDSQWSGPALYTNATQEGIAQANWRTGYAGTLDYYNGMMFYGNNRSRQRFITNLKHLGPGQGSPAELFTSTNINGNVTIGTTTVSGVSAAHIASVFVGQYVLDIGFLPPGASPLFSADTMVVSVSATSFDIDKPALGSSVGAFLMVWDWIGIEDAVYPGFVYRIFPDSGVGGVPFASSHFFPASYYQPSAAVRLAPNPSGAEYVFNKVSGTWDGVHFLPSAWLYCDNTSSIRITDGIQFLFESKAVDGPMFTVKSTKPLAFDRPIDSVFGLESYQDYGPAYLFYSKLYEPEAVPLGNFVIVGSEKEKILRVIATRDSLWVFKTDGLWRVTGDSPETLRVDSFDPTCKMVSTAPQLATKYGNDVYVWSARGIHRVNDGGVVEIDDGLRQYLLETIGPIQTSALQPYSTNSAGDRWIGFRPTSTGNKLFIYWPDTDAWTYWIPPVPFQCAGGDIQGRPVFADSNLSLYTVDYGTIGDSGTFAPPLFYDIVPNNMGVTCAFVGLQVTHDVFAITGFNLQVGDAFIDASNQMAYVTAILDPVTAEIMPTVVPMVDGICQYLRAFPTRIIWSAIPGAGLGLQSHFTKVTFAFDRVASGLNFTYEFQGYQNVDNVTETEPYAEDATYGFSSGQYPMGFPVVEQRAVPRFGPRRDWGIKTGFSSMQAGQYFRTNGIGILWDVAGYKVTR